VTNFSLPYHTVILSQTGFLPFREDPSDGNDLPLGVPQSKTIRLQIRTDVDWRTGADRYYVEERGVESATDWDWDFTCTPELEEISWDLFNIYMSGLTHIGGLTQAVRTTFLRHENGCNYYAVEFDVLVTRIQCPHCEGGGAVRPYYSECRPCYGQGGFFIVSAYTEEPAIKMLLDAFRRENTLSITDYRD
jgi:hypothetical protein